MDIFLILVLITVLILVGYYFNRSNHNKKFNELEASRLRMPLGLYLYYSVVFRLSGIPPKEIFKALKEARKLGLTIEIDKLTNLFKVIDYEFRNELKKFNNDLIERELRLKRLWSNYILGGTVFELAQLIKETKDEGKPLKVKGNLKTDIERAKEKYLNDLIERILKDKENLPEIPEEKKVQDGIIEKLLRKSLSYELKNKNDNQDLPFKRFILSLKSKIREGKIYFSKESSRELIIFIFRDTYEALYVSMQSGLVIRFKHLMSYLEKNVDIKKILELLNKLHEFNNSINLDELEKFITLKSGENERILSSLIHATKEKIPVSLKELWEYRLRGGNMDTMLETYIIAHRQGIKLAMSDLIIQKSMIRNVEELVENLIKLHQEQIVIGANIQEELDELGRFQDIFEAYSEQDAIIAEKEIKLLDKEIKIPEKEEKSEEKTSKTSDKDIKSIDKGIKTSENGKNQGKIDEKSTDKGGKSIDDKNIITDKEKKSGINDHKAIDKEDKPKEKVNLFKEKFIPYLIKASHLGLNFSLVTLKSYHANGGRIEKLMDVLIQSTQAKLDITVNDCMELAHSNTEPYEILVALKANERGNLKITKKQLMDIHRAGGSIVEFIVAIELATKVGLNIDPVNIELDLIEKRKVLPIIFAIIYAKNEGVKIDYNLCIKLDRIKDSDVPAQIRWAVNPQIFHIDPVTIVTKDAVEVKLKVNVTVRGKFILYSQRNVEDNFKNRVKEALVKEVEQFDKYIDLVSSLNKVAWRIYMRMRAEMNQNDFPEMKTSEIQNQNAVETNLNSISAFEILDINIPNLEIESEKRYNIQSEEVKLDKLLLQMHSEKQRHTAKALEIEAKTNLINSRAELNFGMSEAFKNGTFNMKDYLKRKIFDDDSADPIDIVH